MSKKIEIGDNLMVVIIVGIIFAMWTLIAILA
jgi:hypothetical protein